jgi:hypothetical protein
MNNLINWQEQSPLFAHIYAQGDDYFQTLPGLSAAFINDHIICCIDERIEGSIHCAGSLVLMDAEEATAFCAASTATAITSHQNCGAMRLAYEKEFGTEMASMLTDEALDRYAVVATRSLAKRYHLKYLGHFHDEDLHGSSTAHAARIIYVVMTRTGFNPYLVPGLPHGFVINGGFEEGDYSAEEVDLALAIAFGEYGFGELFTLDTPCVLALVTAIGHVSERLIEKLTKSVAKYQGRVCMVEFNQPL